MAIKRTIGRSKFVQPSGIVVDSGGQAMAQASQNIANAITSITKNVDQNQLETAIIEAEKQGKQIGARTHKVYDAQGNASVVPKPLSTMDLNSLFKPNLFNKKNEAKAKAYFEKQAILSYGKAVSNDAINAAAISLEKNRGSLDDSGTLSQQRSSNSYIESLKGSLDEDVYNEIFPTISRIWASSVRQSSAIAMDNVRKTNTTTAIKQIDWLTNLEIDHRSGGNDREDEDNETLPWIRQQKLEAFELLKNNSTDLNAYTKVVDAAKENLEKGIVVRAVGAGNTSGMSYSELANMVISSSKVFDLDKSVNSENVLKAGMNEITKLSKIETMQNKEALAKSTGSFHDLVINMFKNNVMPTNSQIEELDEKHQSTILNWVKKWGKAEDNLEVKNFNNKVAKELVNFNFAKTHNMINVDKSDHAVSSSVLNKKASEKAMANLLIKSKNSNISTSNLNAIYKAELLETHKLIVKNNGEMEASFELMFNGVTPQASHPNTLRSTLYTDRLIAQNFIGNNPKINAYTLKGWYKKVDAYETDFNKTQKHAKLLNGASQNMKFGVGLTNDMLSALKKEISNTIEIIKPNGELSIVDVDLLSKDNIIREASIKSTVAYALSINVLSENALNILNSAPTLKYGKDDRGFYHIKELYGTLKNTFQETGGADWIDSWKTFATNNNLETTMLDGMQFYEDASEFNKNHAPGTGSRAISNFFNVKEGDGNDKSIILDTIKENATFIDNNFLSDVLYPYLKDRPVVKNGLKKWFNDNNIKHLNDLVIDQPIILNEITKFVQGKIRTGKLDIDNKDKALTGAVFEAFYKFSGMLSAEVDAEGKSHLMIGNNALTEGQLTIPGSAYELTQSDIILDFKDKYFLAGANIQSGDIAVREAIDKDRLMFLTNNEITGDKTYKVVAHTEDGRFETIIGNYRYEWEDSRDKLFYYEAMDKIPNSTVRNLLASVKFFPKSNRDAVIESLKNGSDWADGWRSIVAGYNQLAIDVKYVQTIPSEILPIVENPATKKELMEWFDTIGWRLFRFDLR